MRNEPRKEGGAAPASRPVQIAPRALAAILGTDGLLLLSLLLAADVAVVAMAGAFELGWAHDWNYRLGTESGYAEVVQYIKEYWIALCFAALAWRTRNPVYLVLSVAFTYLLLDDATEIHERGGLWLEQRLGLMPTLGLREQDLGELLVSAGAGTVLLISGAAAYRFSDARSRRVALLTLAAVVVLAFFGIGMDLVHQMLAETRLAFPLEVVEDGGELVTLSTIAAALFAFLRRELEREA